MAIALLGLTAIPEPVRHPDRAFRPRLHVGVPAGMEHVMLGAGLSVFAALGMLGLLLSIGIPGRLMSGSSVGAGREHVHHVLALRGRTHVHGLDPWRTDGRQHQGGSAGRIRRARALLR